MTTDIIKHVILRGNVYIGDQKAPFVTSGESVLGALEYDISKDLIKCHECGGWFQNLGGHIPMQHSIKAREYKIRHGLLLSTGLINKRLKKERAALPKFTLPATKTGVGIARKVGQPKPSLTDVRDDIQCEGGSVVTADKCKSSRWQSYESKNEKGCCHAQLLNRLRVIAERLGRTPGHRDLRANGLHPNSLLHAFNVKTIAEVVTLAGLSPKVRRRGDSKYGKEVLVEMLRDFYVAHQRLPLTSEYRSGVFPAKSSFIKWFGCLRNACVAAGLGNVYERQFKAGLDIRVAALTRLRVAKSL